MDKDNWMRDSHLTGYFRDGLRRVDLVIVSQDCTNRDVETYKLNFMVNTIDIGFDIEVEAGVMNKNQRLLFIKVHAPDVLIQLYGRMFDIYKYFKRNHAEEIHSLVPDEKLLLRLVRYSNPGSFEVSSYERSLIVYKALQMIAFGEPRNYVGIHRMIDRGLFLDVYPLHEGPHFLVPGQDPVRLNGRQAVFYKGAGYSNLFLPMPIHLIREYFGDKIGFLFTFYQYTLLFLLIIGIPGLIMYFPDSNPGPAYYVTAQFGGYGFKVCPKCLDLDACPSLSSDTYADEVKYQKSLDNSLYHWYSLIVFIAGIIMYLLWRLIEYYLNWMWEVNEKEMRTAFRTTTFDGSPPFTSTSCKCMKYIQWAIYTIKTGWKLREFLISLLIICFFFLLQPLIILLQQKLLRPLGKLDIYSYSFLPMKYLEAGNALLNGMLILGLEKVWSNCVKWFCRSATYVCEDDYEQSYVVKLFGFSFFINFTYIFFVMFLKGAFFTFPLDADRFISKSPLQPSMMHCGLISCIHEAYIAAIFTFVGKTVLYEALYIYKWLKLPNDVPGPAEPEPAPSEDSGITQDPSRKKQRVPYDDENVPSWEREFGLLPCDTDLIYNKFNYIFLQLCFATFFAWIFPLGTIIIFVLNIWEMRWWLTELVLHRRRPLVPEQWGLGTWRKVLWVLPYVAATLNIIGISRNSVTIIAKFMGRFANAPKAWKEGQHYFSVENLMYTFNNDEMDRQYADRGTSSSGWFWGIFGESAKFTCHSPGQYFNGKYEYRINGTGVKVSKERNFITTYDRTNLVDLWYVKWHYAMFVLAAQLLVILLGMFLHHVFPRSIECVEDATTVERAARFYRARRYARRQDSAAQTAHDQPEEGSMTPP